MLRRYEWQSRIVEVCRQYQALTQATKHFRLAAKKDPTILREKITPRDIEEAENNLEGIFIVRVYAEFETGLRDYWDTVRPTHPMMGILMDSVAAQRKVPASVSKNAHLVREYRNGLVHEREDAPDSVPVDIARSHLSRFFSFLPEDW